MTDAAASAPKPKTTKASGSGADLGDKKRFEVKKACSFHLKSYTRIYIS